MMKKAQRAERAQAFLEGALEPDDLNDLYDLRYRNARLRETVPQADREALAAAPPPAVPEPGVPPAIAEELRRLRHEHIRLRELAPVAALQAMAAEDRRMRRLELEMSPLAPIVELLALTTPMRMSYAEHDARGRIIGHNRETVVLALARRADGSTTPFTKHDIAGEPLTVRHPDAELELGRAYSVDDAGEATPTVPDTAADEMAEITAISSDARSAVARLVPVRKAAGVK
jgi:hypothetical protein